MKTIKEYKGYIYTIPKAGTYLMSEFLSQIGSSSTGWHISFDKYLDTLGFNDKTNKQTPTRTKKDRLYIGSFRKIPFGHHAFGHYSPLYLPPRILSKDYKCLCVKRDPKEVLLSEFIDFRYRRADVEEFSKKKYKNSIEAFEAYIKHHAPVIKKICQNFLLLEEVHKNKIYIELIGPNKFYFADFKTFLNKEKGPKVAAEIAKFFASHLTEKGAGIAWQAALEADNKTKSIDAEIDIPRTEFWSEKALAGYKALGFEEIAQKLGY